MKDADSKAIAALISDIMDVKDGRKRKPQKVEAYMSLYYRQKVQPIVDGAQDVSVNDAVAAAASQGSQATKLSPTLTTIMAKAREMLKTESPEVLMEVEERLKEMSSQTEKEKKSKTKDKQ